MPCMWGQSNPELPELNDYFTLLQYIAWKDTQTESLLMGHIRGLELSGSVCLACAEAWGSIPQNKKIRPSSHRLPDLMP